MPLSHEPLLGSLILDHIQYLSPVRTAPCTYPIEHLLYDDLGGVLQGQSLRWGLVSCDLHREDKQGKRPSTDWSEAQLHTDLSHSTGFWSKTHTSVLPLLSIHLAGG